MRVLLAATVLMLATGDAFRRGIEEYRSSRFKEALAAFTEAEHEAGVAASAELLYNRALAALAAGVPQVAEICAEKAAVRGGVAFRDLRDFVLGNAALLRSARAEAEAQLREADPTALAQAIRYAEQAIAHWTRAARARDEWPEANRNVERALQTLERLRKSKEEAEKKRKKKTKKPKDSEEENDEKEEDERKAIAQKREQGLSAEDLAALLAQLAKNEQDKRKVRRDRQRERRKSLEKDW